VNDARRVARLEELLARVRANASQPHVVYAAGPPAANGASYAHAAEESSGPELGVDEAAGDPALDELDYEAERIAARACLEQDAEAALVLRHQWRGVTFAEDEDDAPQSAWGTEDRPATPLLPAESALLVAEDDSIAPDAIVPSIESTAPSPEVLALQKRRSPVPEPEVEEERPTSELERAIELVARMRGSELDGRAIWDAVASELRERPSTARPATPEVELSRSDVPLSPLPSLGPLSPLPPMGPMPALPRLPDFSRASDDLGRRSAPHLVLEADSLPPPAHPDSIPLPFSTTPSFAPPSFLPPSAEPSASNASLLPKRARRRWHRFTTARRKLTARARGMSKKRRWFVALSASAALAVITLFVYDRFVVAKQVAAVPSALSPSAVTTQTAVVPTLGPTTHEASIPLRGSAPNTTPVTMNPSALAGAVTSAPAARPPSPDASALPKDHGFLYVTTKAPTPVYLNGIVAGDSGTWLEVTCGLRHIRLARPGTPAPGGSFPMWSTEGTSVLVPCRGAASVSIDLPAVDTPE
jgi:hypothetical protein